MSFIKVKCNICEGNDYVVLYKSNLKKSGPSVKEYTSTVNDYASYNDIVKCKKCGLVYMNPRDKNVNSLYKDVVDKDYIESWDERKNTFKKHLTEINKYKKNGKLLDIGCYAGIFPTLAREEGFDVTGIEPSKWAASYAADKSKSLIFQGSWSEIKLKKNSFDVITMWDVIEHLEDPLGCLKAAYSWIKKGGALAVTTHDINSIMAKIMGNKYPWLMRFHLYHFDSKSLARIIEKAGFKVDVKRTYSKMFSIRYLLERVGIRTRLNFFSKISIPIYTGDMMIIIATKK